VIKMLWLTDDKCPYCKKRVFVKIAVGGNVFGIKLIDEKTYKELCKLNKIKVNIKKKILELTIDGFFS